MGIDFREMGLFRPNWKFGFHSNRSLCHYCLSNILLGQVVSFKHATQISASEVPLVKSINMHVFLCYLETRKHFSQGDFSFGNSARETANLKAFRSGEKSQYCIRTWGYPHILFVLYMQSKVHFEKEKFRRLKIQYQEF